MRRPDVNKGRSACVTDSAARDRALSCVSDALDARTFASLACTCKALAKIGREVCDKRAADISSGQEPQPIPCVNELDTELYPKDFVYRKNSVHPVVAQLADVKGCMCGRYTGCDENCPCISNAWGDSPFDSAGRLRSLVGDPEAASQPDILLTECGLACACAPSCSRCVTQTNVTQQLSIRKTAHTWHGAPRKGWAGFAMLDIPKGTFVAEYAGEVVSTAEAVCRLQQYDSQRASSGHALLVLREYLPSGRACLRTNIDATCIGNVSRFFNHSCGGGNLMLVVIRATGSPVPRVCLFASCNIQSGDELTFSYGATPTSSSNVQDLAEETKHSCVSVSQSSLQVHQRHCYCGTSECIGFMPAGL